MGLLLTYMVFNFSISIRCGISPHTQKILFSSNPNEWWDQRKRKRNPKQPDFKHKDTGEALWLSEYDPPWVKRQLQLFDSKIAGGSAGRRSRVTNWVYDEQLISIKEDEYG